VITPGAGSLLQAIEEGSRAALAVQKDLRAAQVAKQATLLAKNL
jgi:hypothetical protein